MRRTPRAARLVGMTTTASRAGRPDAPPRPRREWWIPASLLALTFVPVAAGAARLVDLSSGRTSRERALLRPPGPRRGAHPRGDDVLRAGGLPVHALLPPSPSALAPVERSRARPGRPRGSGERAGDGGVRPPAGLRQHRADVAPPGLRHADGGGAGAGPRRDPRAGTCARTSGGWRGRTPSRRAPARRRSCSARWCSFVDQPGGGLKAAGMGFAWVLNLAVAEWLVRRSQARQSSRRV